ncbi:DBH-like monooxygenase protein 2 homolog [Polyodon spathula]|uniref:DBH-like monooxygenase protein 2 homolog n=1 Tax=Polyodon spathula TaxID=7913 RepID=UPI001B7EFF4D|nr:DBH-like monooxygenase protein 2 homolog [Polyodon spathula]
MFVPGLCSKLLLCAGLASVLGQDSGDMPFSETLDSAGSVSLCWGFDSKQETITFQLACKTSGWVGFGLSPSRKMDRADIVLGGGGGESQRDHLLHEVCSPHVLSNSACGWLTLQDRHAVGAQLPQVDGSQDYILLSLKEDST